MVARNDRYRDQDNNNWNYCQSLFGLTATITTASTAITSAARQPLLQTRYPFEILPVFIISSSLVSNCCNDRNTLCYIIWKQSNNMNSSSTAQDSNDTTNASNDTNSNTMRNTKAICLYLPHLLSTWNNTLNVLWNGLLHHYENTTIAPSRKCRTVTATREGEVVETEAAPHTEEEGIMNSRNDNDNDEDDDDMEAILHRYMEDQTHPES